MSPKKTSRKQYGWACLTVGHFHLLQEAAAKCIRRAQRRRQPIKADPNAFSGQIEPEELARWAFGEWICYAHESGQVLRKIGQRIGLSVERTRQIEAKHLRKVRGGLWPLIGLPDMSGILREIAGDLLPSIWRYTWSKAQAEKIESQRLRRLASEKRHIELVEHRAHQINDQRESLKLSSSRFDRLDDYIFLRGGCRNGIYLHGVRAPSGKILVRDKNEDHYYVKTDDTTKQGARIWQYE